MAISLPGKRPGGSYTLVLSGFTWAQAGAHLHWGVCWGWNQGLMHAWQTLTPELYPKPFFILKEDLYDAHTGLEGVSSCLSLLSSWTHRCMLPLEQR